MSNRHGPRKEQGPCRVRSESLHLLSSLSVTLPLGSNNRFIQCPGGIAMPLYMDVHDHVEGLAAEAVADAHNKDLET